MKSVEKSSKSTIKKVGDFLSGEFLAKSKIRGEVVLIAVLLFVYISIQYWMDNLAKEEIKLKKQNKVLRARQVTLTFELIKAGQRSNLEQMLKEYNMDLKAPTTPPYVIEIEDE